jgi:GAF domain-containing protein
VAARPSTARPASFSTRLAAVRLGDRKPDALARLVADEALRAIGGDRAVVWAYRAALRRLLLEQEGLPVDSIDVSAGEGAAVVSGPWLWRGSVTGVRARLLEASFPGRSAQGDQLAFPLRAGDRLVGLLLIEHPPLAAAEEIEPAVQPFAEQAAVLLHNAAQHAAAQRNEANLQALYETAGDMTSTLEPDAVLHAIAKRARALLDASIAHVMLADGETGEIAMRVSEGTTQAAFATLRLKRGSGLGGRVAERRTPFYTSDYLNDSRFGHDSTVDATVRAEGVRSIVGVPMIAGDAFIGVLFVAERTVRTFTDADVDVLLGLAHHAAIALRNAELYDRATAAVAKLEHINEIVHLQNTRLQRAEQLPSQLPQAMLAGQGLSDIVGLMAGFLGAHVMVFDHRRRVRAVAGASDDFAARLCAEGLERSMSRPRAVREAVRTVEARRPAVLGRRLVLPIVARDEVLGSIWVAGALDDDRPLIEQAARVVALDLLKDRAVAEVERRVGRELLDALLAEDPTVDAGLERRASELGVDLSVPHRILALRPSRGGGEAIRALRAQRWCSFVAEYGPFVLALVPGSEAAVTESLRSVIDGTARAVVSAPCGTVADYRPQFLAARRVLELLGDRDGPPVIDLDDAWVLTLLARGGNEAELRRFVDSRLGPLIRHDAEHGLGLIGTLEAYLDADRSPTRAALALNVHVNTVYYRLDRMKALLGDRLSDPRRAVDLQVALLAHRLLV